MKKQLFNDNWNVLQGSGSALAALFGGPGEELEAITLPHDAVILTERVNTPLGFGMGFYQGQNINYQKKFTLSMEDAEKVVWLEFEGVYQNAFVYINDAFAGRCTYGYSNYYLDVTAFIKFGAENKIKVVVKNEVLSGRWYTGGGIYRNVSIMLGDKLHFKCEGTKINATDIDADQAVVRVEAPIEYVGYQAVGAEMVTEIIDIQGKVVASDRAPITVFDHETKTLRRQLVVKKPKLWDLDQPYLYTCHTKLQAEDKIVDEDKTTFGIRKLQLDAGKGLRINGKTVKLRGGCIHHDNGVIGAVTFPHTEERRIQKLKEAGFNAIRMAHHPIGRTLLDACDKLGMLVMEEFTDTWTTTKLDFDYGFHFDQCWEQDVINMVNKDYNHPCVILYSIGNEIPETGSHIDAAWGKKIADKIRSLDDTRYTVNCVNFLLAALNHMDEIIAEQGVADDGSPREVNTMMNNMGELTALLINHEITTKITEEAFAQVDVSGYNYASHRYDKDIQRYPNRILVGSENYTNELARNWELVEKHPQVLGDFVWTAWDYIGEAGIGKLSYGDAPVSFYGAWPWKHAYCGTINIIGDRRPVSYWREIVWGLRKEPYIAVCPPEHYGEKVNLGQWGWSDSINCWNWPGYEGKPIKVEVYSDAEEVELFVNGVSIERKAVGAVTPCLAIFDTIYTPGEMKAISYKNGISEEYILYSAQNDSCLKVEVSQSELQAGCGDISYLEISIVDEKGILNPASTKTITVTVEGEGSLMGLGSADPLSEENYWEKTCRVFEGRALAAIRSGKQAGEITVTFSAEACEIKSIKLKVY